MRVKKSETSGAEKKANPVDLPEEPAGPRFRLGQRPGDRPPGEGRSGHRRIFLRY